MHLIDFNINFQLNSFLIYFYIWNDSMIICILGWQHLSVNDSMLFYVILFAPFIWNHQIVITKNLAYSILILCNWHERYVFHFGDFKWNFFSIGLSNPFDLEFYDLCTRMCIDPSVATVDFLFTKRTKQKSNSMLIIVVGAAGRQCEAIHEIRQNIPIYFCMFNKYCFIVVILIVIDTEWTLAMSSFLISVLFRIVCDILKFDLYVWVRVRWTWLWFNFWEALLSMFVAYCSFALLLRQLWNQFDGLDWIWFATGKV